MQFNAALQQKILLMILCLIQVQSLLIVQVVALALDWMLVMDSKVRKFHLIMIHCLSNYQRMP